MFDIVDMLRKSEKLRKEILHGNFDLKDKSQGNKEDDHGAVSNEEDNFIKSYPDKITLMDRSIIAKSGYYNMTKEEKDILKMLD